MSMNKRGWIVLTVLVAMILLPQVFVLTELDRIIKDGPVLEASVKNAAAESSRNTDKLQAGDAVSRLHGLRWQIAGAALLSAVLVLIAVAATLHGSKIFFHDIIVELDKLAGRIDSTSYAVKTTGTLLADDTRRQSSAIMQTAQTHKGIATLSRDNAAHARNANARIRDYSEKVETANQTLQRLIQSMNDIKHASEGIKKIVDDINGIAAKTNLLAINAGVESAKAGMAGRTFGIIADEVRNLALVSSDSAKQTNTLIESTIEKINNGAATVSQVVDVFRDTAAFVEDIKVNMEAISGAARDQSDKLHSLEAPLDELESLTDRNVDNSKQTDAISEELQKNGEELRVFLGNFILKTISRRSLSESVLSRTLAEIEKLVCHLQPAGLDKTAHMRILTIGKKRFNHRVEAIYTCRDDGSFIYSDPPAGIPDARIRPWWQKAISGRPYVSPIYISAINQKPCCTISVPFYAQNDLIAGVLGVDLNV